MNILWFLDKEFDVVLNVSARIATIQYLERNNKLKIITTFRKEKKRWQEFKSEVIYLRRINLPIIKLLSLYHQHLKYLNKTTEYQDIDLVFANTFDVFLLKKLAKMAEAYDFKLVLDVRTLPVESDYLKKKMRDFLFRRCLKFAANHFDGITYITEEMKVFCDRKYRLPEYKHAVWGSGVDIEKFKPSETQQDRSNFRILYHGNIQRNRGLESVVKAMDILRPYDIEFLMLGAGEAVAEIEDLVHKLDLGAKVIFHPSVSHDKVPQFINEADVGILPFPDWPGWNTSSPIKLFEYLACGKPVVVTKIPAHLNVLDGRRFAFWAETSSPECLAESIMEAFNSTENNIELSKEARSFVTMNFSWEKQFSILEDLFRNI